MITALRPWPSKAERQAGLQAAAQEREAARRRTGHAASVAQSIEEIVYGDNHFAEAIAETIRRGRHHREGT